MSVLPHVLDNRVIDGSEVVVGPPTILIYVRGLVNLEDTEELKNYVN
jgi:hypothetical protein